MSLKGKRIIVGLTGGIACYKVPYLVRACVKDGAEVKVLMTTAATEFITPLTMETVSQNSVAVSMFPEREYVATRHIAMAEWADLFVIAPATANFLGKVANGICDDLLTTIVCATARPILLVPAMNPQMWRNPITQRNFDYLKELGYLSVGPEKGEMAERGHVGVGRMAEPESIFEAVRDFFRKSPKKKA
jgi:phosphopantothenoylcysteine decarboxylase/phosphopantothenate--cysteine ligase